MAARPDAKTIRERFAANPYVAYHARRYAYLLELAADLVNDGPILDVAPSPCTTLLRDTLGRPVDTLGINGPGPTGDDSSQAGTHTHYDLEHAAGHATWPRIGPFGLIVFAEVLEHVPIAPEHTLGMLTSLLAPGGVLLLQTPNAAALHKRLALLAGRHPYNRILPRDELRATHFREYTAAELREEAARCGLAVERADARAYFDYRYRPHVEPGSPRARLAGMVRAAYRVTPATMRPGFTVVARRAHDGSPRRST